MVMAESSLATWVLDSGSPPHSLNDKSPLQNWKQYDIIGQIILHEQEVYPSLSLWHMLPIARTITISSGTTVCHGVVVLL